VNKKLPAGGLTDTSAILNLKKNVLLLVRIVKSEVILAGFPGTARQGRCGNPTKPYLELLLTLSPAIFLEPNLLKY
jgi:hypothetical protein